jgi:hypothetical protein
MSRGYVYLLLLDRAWQVGGSVEHLEGKGGKSDVAIPMFLCGSPHSCQSDVSMWLPSSVSVKDHTVLVLMASLELCTNRMSGFIGPNKSSSFCNYYV